MKIKPNKQIDQERAFLETFEDVHHPLPLGHNAKSRPTGRTNIIPFRRRSTTKPKSRSRRSKLLSKFVIGLMILGLSDHAIAGVFRAIGPDYLSRLDQLNGIELVDANGDRFAIRANNTSTLSLPVQSWSDNMDKFSARAIFKEDRGLGQEKSLRRYLGTDLLSLAKAAYDYTFKGKRRGASTIVHQICSRLLNSNNIRANLGGVYARLKEIECGAVITAQLHGSRDSIISNYATHAPSVIGAKNSNFGAPVHGVVLGSRLLFDKEFEELRSCELAVLLASFQRPVMFPGQSKDKSQSNHSWAQVVRIAVEDNKEFAESFPRNDLADSNCFATLKRPWEGHQVYHPEVGLSRGLKEWYPQAKKEISALDPRKTQNLSLSARGQSAGDSALKAELCKIQASKRLYKNVCHKNGIIRASVRVLISNNAGELVQAHALGPGSFNAINEPENSSNLSRGSIGKGLFMPLLQNVPLCRAKFNNIHDPDGSVGVDPKDCKKLGYVSLKTTAALSLNLSMIHGLNIVPKAKLEAFKSLHGYKAEDSIPDIVLGIKSLPLQRILGSYGALTNTIGGKRAIGYSPHIIIGSQKMEIDLSSEAMSGQFVEALFSGALKRGTARQFSKKMKLAGFTVLTAKTGTSESIGKSERGKHIVGTLKGRDSKHYTYFVEMASPDSSRLTDNQVLNTGDLAALLVAVLQSGRTKGIAQ